MSDPLEKVMKERARQDKRWGPQNHDDLYWLGILMEEVGEAAKYVIERNSAFTHREVVEVCAVALAWLECMERRAALRETEDETN
jgi:hypothetical protein